MRPESLEFLKDLLKTPSPSGFEERVQEVVKAYVSQYADEVYKDVQGNQYAVRNKDAELRIMLAGHVDEIGLMVNTIDDSGYIGFVPIGGIDAATLPGSRVEVHGEDGPVPGVIGRKAIHLTPQEDRKKFTEIHEMWIDIGAKDKADAQSVVAIGDAITMAVGFQELRDDKVVARALDDRIGAFVCVEAMRLLADRNIDVALYCVTTVQEEIGLRGATTSAYGCHPHAGLAVDVAWATDHPRGEGERYGFTSIGGGPILDRGPNINPHVRAGLVAAAKEHDIPFQARAMPRGTGTDANAMQLSRGGVATAIIGIPNRYMHTPAELVSLKDVQWASQLIAEWVATLTPETSFIP
jgi:endoglucanase